MYQYLIAVVVIVASTLMHIDSAVGQVEISIDDIFISPSNSTIPSSFEVYLALNGQPQTDLAGFQVTLNLTEANAPATTVDFTSINAPLVRPYALAPNSASPVGSVSSGGAVVEFGDFLLSGQSTVFDGNGFAQVNFEVDGGLQVGDSYLIEISTDPTETFLATPGNGRLPFAVNNGSISVIPEPGALPMFFLGLALAARRRRSKSVAR